MNDEAPAATRGDITRDALIQAAIEVFGRDGFNAASTRAISETAGVNLALIGYHFGGKPGLYLAALRFIAARVIERMGPLVAAIEADLAAAEQKRSSKRSAERARSALQELIGAFVGMLASDESAAWARLILREQQNPSDGFDVLYHGFMHRLLGITSRLVARARDLDAASDECKLTAMTILGQAVVFRAARAAVMREMDWQTLGQAELTEVRAVLGRNIAAILQAEKSR
jgi:TetR/AcrR family transcriptional regulator, regulator of cefoperazone and chloramphenicol sensitivity